jgi:hypothetical protein
MVWTCHTSQNQTTLGQNLSDYFHGRRSCRVKSACRSADRRQEDETLGFAKSNKMLGWKMPGSAPEIDWPRELKERGSAEDPGILLAGQAKIAGVAFKVTALRMSKGTRMPDHRDEVPEEIYEVSLDNMPEDIECLADSIQPELIALNGADYL